MTVTEIIDGILEREGENRPDFLTPGDKGGRTSWGISERAHPEAWHAGPPTRAEAALIYMAQYVTPFELLGSYSPQVMDQMIDFGVTSGPKVAIYWFQRVLSVTPDGRIGKHTMAAYAAVLPHYVLLNNALVAARLKFIDTLTDAEKSQKQFEEGWESRALSFLVL